MNSLKTYLDKLTPSQMVCLQQKLGIISKESNTELIIKKLFENEDYHIFCEQERKKDARNVYQSIIMANNHDVINSSKSKNEIRTIQNDFSKNIQQKEIQFPILFIKYCIDSQYPKSSSIESVPRPLQTNLNCKEKIDENFREIDFTKKITQINKSHPERKIKRSRTSFGHHQKRVMKDLFQRNQNPERHELKELASETGVKPQLMKVCFYFHEFWYHFCVKISYVEF